MNGGNRIPGEKIGSAPDKRGSAPKDKQGISIELHHRNQTEEGPIDEMTREDHREGENFKRNHSNTGQQPSQINKSNAKALRENHWKKEWDRGRFNVNNNDKK